MLRWDAGRAGWHKQLPAVLLSGAHVERDGCGEGKERHLYGRSTSFIVMLLHLLRLLPESEKVNFIEQVSRVRDEATWLFICGGQGHVLKPVRRCLLYLYLYLYCICTCMLYTL
jgi:hypothetical protein